MKRLLVFILALVSGIVFVVPPSAAAAAPAETESLVGSQFAESFPADEYTADEAAEVAIDLLIKHNRTIVRCGVSVLWAILPAARVVKSLSGAQAAKAARWSREATRAEQLRAFESIVAAAGAMLGPACDATAQLGLAAYAIVDEADLNGSTYFRDASTYRQRIFIGECVISIEVGESVYESVPYKGCFRKS